MSDRRYFIDRTGIGRRLSLDEVKKLFMALLNDIHRNHNDYFEYAKKRVWKPNPEDYILTHLRLNSVWPVEDRIQDYDDVTLFTIIEFLYDWVVFPVFFSERSPSFRDVEALENAREKAQLEYRKRMNEILKSYAKGYQLTEDGEIQELAPKGLKHLTESIPVTDDKKNIDQRVEYAIAKFLRYGAKPDERKEAIRTIGDVLEYLKKGNVRLDRKDEKDLFQILNKFGFRHHDKSQQDNYTKEDFYELAFYVLLASVRFLMGRLTPLVDDV